MTSLITLLFGFGIGFIAGMFAREIIVAEIYRDYRRRGIDG